MRLTPAHCYAISALLQLAELEPGVSVAARDLAKQGQLPKPYLVQVLGKLARAGIVLSSLGATGGYRLAMEPEQISLLDVVEAVDNVLADAGALEVGGFNPHSVELVEQALVDVTSKARKQLASLTLSDLRAAKAA